VPAALADDLMPSGMWNEMCESLDRHGVTVANIGRDSLGEGGN